MTRLVVKRESLGVNTRHTSPSYVDGNDEQVLVSSQRGLPTSSTLGASISEGTAFTTGYVYMNASKLANGANFDIAIAFGGTTEASVDITGLCAGNAEGYLYEGATTSGGTALPIINMNRNSTNTGNGAAVHMPTVTATGTLIGNYLLMGGVKKKAAGGDSAAKSLILKPLTTYLLRMTNTSGSAQVAEIRVTWYE